ncbi:MAG: biotin/lipoyl-binding protein [Prolixibacteraceae bacterium]|nr:biotin/lipoyl-binding protein [Prolixibacteraceae bacterium]
MKLKFSKKEKKQAVKYIACGKGKKKHEISFQQDKGVKINNKIANIEVSKEEGLFFIKWNNRRYIAEIAEKNQNKYIVLVNGVSYDFTIETPISFKRRKYLEKNQPKSKVQEVAAPMPGKIVEVFAEENGSIKEGDPLFILEAMKMQNEIISHVNGKVTKINVKANESVEKGAVLVEIE